MIFFLLRWPGVAKLYAYWIVVNYREAYRMFAVNGILFNHESPRRGETFVTRKITRSVAKIHLNELECFELGERMLEIFISADHHTHGHNLFIISSLLFFIWNLLIISCAHDSLTSINHPIDLLFIWLEISSWFSI